MDTPSDTPPGTQFVPVTRGGYPALMFIEFGPGEEWTATEVSTPRGELTHLDSRSRAVLRAYAADLLARIDRAFYLDATTLRLPTGPLNISPED